MSGTDMSEHEVFCFTESASAVLVGDRKDKPEDAVWVPKSLCESYPASGMRGSIVLPEWKARELGWE